MLENYSLLQESTDPGRVVIHSESASWMKALNCYRHDFYHVADYAKLCARHENARALAFEICFEHGRLFVPMLIRPVATMLNSDAQDAHTPYGYSGPLVQTASAALAQDILSSGLKRLRDVLRTLGIVSAFIRWHPLLTTLPESLPAGVGVCLRDEIVVIDLTKPEGLRWSEMRRNHRQNIDRLQRDGFKAVFDNSRAAVSIFADMYRRTMQRVAASNFYHFSKDYIFDLMNIQGASPQLCLVKHDGDVVCGGLFVGSGDVLTCHLSATQTAFLPHSPSKLMFWAAGCWGRSVGMKILNIGGGLGGRSDTPLFRFKQGFSPDRCIFHALGIVCDDYHYDELCRRARRLREVQPGEPIGSAYFPAYHIGRQDVTELS